MDNGRAEGQYERREVSHDPLNQVDQCIYTFLHLAIPTAAMMEELSAQINETATQISRAKTIRRTFASLPHPRPAGLCDALVDDPDLLTTTSVRRHGLAFTVV